MKQAHFQRAVLLFQQDRFAEAIGELHLQLAEEADDPATHSLLALCLARLEKYGEATEHAQRAIHLAPDFPHGFYVLANIQLQRNRDTEARATIQEALRLDPYDVNSYALLAQLELRASKWREALAAANQGLEIEPEHGLCTNLRAQALVHLGDKAAAAETMGQALARRPDDALTHANQGWALLHQGEPRQACEHFREALRLDPEMDWARQGIVEGMKARNFIYRWLLAYFLWMVRLSPGVRWGLVIGAFFGMQWVQKVAAGSPEWGPWLWPLVYAYFGFVLMSWLAPSFFNLLLRLDKFGRHALSSDQIAGANVLAASLGFALLLLVPALWTGDVMLTYCALMSVLLALPASAIYVCSAGWPRQAMAATTLALLSGIFVILLTWAFEKHLPAAMLALTLVLRRFMPWAMLGSQFLANYLATVTVRK